MTFGLESFSKVYIHFLTKEKYHSAHICRRKKNAVKYLHSHQQCLAKLGSQLVHYGQLNPLYATLMGEHAYLVRAHTLEEIYEMAAYLHAQ